MSESDDVTAGTREHYDDAALYDYEYRRRRGDVRFYVDLAEVLAGERSEILELACGSGRVTAGLLRAGHTVTGLDLAPTMLAAAQRRVDRLGRASSARCTLMRGDMRQFSLARRFPLVVMAFNSFEHLYTRVDVGACLDRVREHLAPGGHLVFDVQNPDLRWLTRDPARRWARTVFTHPTHDEKWVYSTNHDYDPVSQIVVIRLYYAPRERRGRERVVRLSQRKFFPAELEALLAHNGFRAVQRFGDFDGTALDSDSHTQILVCRADEERSHRPSGRSGHVVARTGVVREPDHLHYLRKGRVYRSALVAADGEETAPAMIADPQIAEDRGRYVYLLDRDGHIVRIPRPS